MKNLQRAAEPSPVGRTSRQRDTMSHLVSQRNSLVNRLESGSRQIEEMRATGQNVDEWERFWIRLLRQYEELCDKLAELEYEGELRRAG